jgi:hypothetical protein
LAEANVYEQEHQGSQALTAFAQAADAEGDDPTAEQSLLLAGAREGYRVNPNFSLLSDFSIQAIFDATTIYVLNAKVDGLTPVPPTDLALLPPPHSALQTEEAVGYHLHLNHLPPIGGIFELRNARGIISVPQNNSILNADTYDYSANISVDPTIHLGTNAVTFASGVQGTIRRDSISPVQLNQNLFRAFTYASTSSFYNVISANGYVIYETGPFTESNFHSRLLTGAINFRVGAPWAKTALITGWGATDQQFAVEDVNDYYTSSSIGLTHQFGKFLNVEALVEDQRAYRTSGTRSGIAQALRPAGSIDYTPTLHWGVHASTAYSNNRSFHVYDTSENNFSISYTRALGHEFSGGPGQAPLRYPIRISAGFQQQDFFNFTGKSEQLRPYVSVSLF